MDFLKSCIQTEDLIELITELLQVAGIRKSHMTPFYPMGNVQAECFNYTLENMWLQMIQTLRFSYHCAVDKTTGFHFSF